MLSMLHLELTLIRRSKVILVILLGLPIWALATSIVVATLEGGPEPLFFVQSFPLVAGFGWMRSTIVSLKRYRQLESLFVLSVTAKDVVTGNLLMWGIYCVYMLLVYLPIYLAGIIPIRDFVILFLFTLLLTAARCVANYVAMLIKRAHLIQLAELLVVFAFVFKWRHILGITDQPYVWLVLPISLIAVAMTYGMSARLSKERIILSSE